MGAALGVAAIPYPQDVDEQHVDDVLSDDLLIEPPADLTIANTLVVAIGRTGVAAGSMWAEIGGHVLLVDDGGAQHGLHDVPFVDLSTAGWAVELRRAMETALHGRARVAIIGAAGGEVVRTAQRVVEEVVGDLVEVWITLSVDDAADAERVPRGIGASYGCTSAYLIPSANAEERALRAAEAPAVLWELLVQHVTLTT